jgi:hypothetical protein
VASQQIESISAVVTKYAIVVMEDLAASRSIGRASPKIKHGRSQRKLLAARCSVTGRGW